MQDLVISIISFIQYITIEWISWYIESLDVAIDLNNDIPASQHVNVSEFDDGSLADQSGYNTNISQSIESTVTKFISNGVNTGIAKIAADGSKIDKDTLIEQDQGH